MHHWKFVMINHINIRSSKLDFHDHLSTISRKFECCVGSINPTSFYLAILHLLVNKFEALESNRNLLFFIFYRHCVDATFRVCLFCLKCLCFCKILSPFSSMALWKSWSMKPFIAQWKIGWGNEFSPRQVEVILHAFLWSGTSHFPHAFPWSMTHFPHSLFAPMWAPPPASNPCELLCQPLWDPRSSSASPLSVWHP